MFLADEDVSDEISAILNQVDELVAHQIPDPVVAPEPVEIKVPCHIEVNQNIHTGTFDDNDGLEGFSTDWIKNDGNKGGRMGDHFGCPHTDPKKDPKAKKYASLKYETALEKRLKVMDSAAFALCMDNGIPIVVFDFFDGNALERVVKGDAVGTVVSDK